MNKSGHQDAVCKWFVNGSKLRLNKEREGRGGGGGRMMLSEYPIAADSHHQLWLFN